jgi:hypothetical protein
MNKLNFKKNFHHVFIDKELIILDVNSDKFIFFNDTQSKSIYNLLQGLNFEKSEFIDNFTSEFLSESDNNHEINEFYALHGIDSHSWRDIKLYLTDSRKSINFSKKYIVLFIYILVFKIPKLKHRLLVAKLFKKINKKSSSNLTTPNEINFFIHKISRFLPYKLKCLEHSFILYYCLSFFGFNCNLNIGIQKYDFSSHAWVDINGKIIGDDKNLFKNLALILKI